MTQLGVVRTTRDDELGTALGAAVALPGDCWHLCLLLCTARSSRRTMLLVELPTRAATRRLGASGARGAYFSDLMYAMIWSICSGFSDEPKVAGITFGPKPFAIFAFGLAIDSLR